MDDEMKRRFENHYGDMPQVETDYWDLPNGPAWHWWAIAILPLDPQAQVSSYLRGCHDNLHTDTQHTNTLPNMFNLVLNVLC